MTRKPDRVALPMITSSALEKGRVCPGSFTLPRFASSNEFAEEGEERHAEDETAINAGNIPEVYAKRWPGYVFRSEVAYAYDLATEQARELGVGIQRDYARFDLSSFEVPGTLDIEAVSPDGRHLVVVDRKGYDAQAPAGQHTQVRFNALMAARVRKPERITVAINHEITGLDIAELTEFDLDETAYETRQIVVDVARTIEAAKQGKHDEVRFQTGRQCRWCDSFWACDKQKELQALVVAKADAKAELVAFDNDDDANRMIDLLEKLTLFTKKLREAVKARAKTRPIPRGNGRLYGLQPKEGNRKLDAKVVHAFLTERYGAEIADAAVELATTQTAIKRALAFADGVASVDKAMEQILDELDKRGGVKRDTKPELMEYDAPPMPPPQLRVVND